MEVEHREQVRTDPDCELLLGSASWDSSERSVKYGWRDKNGRIARGGEVPIEALPQMLEFAIRNGYLELR